MFDDYPETPTTPECAPTFLNHARLYLKDGMVWPGLASENLPAYVAALTTLRSAELVAQYDTLR